ESILSSVARGKTSIELHAVDIHAPLHRVASLGERHVVNELKRVDDARLAGHALSDAARPVRYRNGTHLRHIGHEVQRRRYAVLYFSFEWNVPRETETERIQQCGRDDHVIFERQRMA